MKKTKLIGGLFSALLLVSSYASADSDYPAYDFQPTIVYQDDSVKAQAQSSKSTSASPAAEAAAESSDDSTLLIGVLLLGGILFAAYKKSAGSSTKVAAGGSTGVSRYIDAQTSSAPAVSGVEKYLQDRV